MVRFEEQVSTIGGYVCPVTVTVNVQLVELPQESLAVVVTVVVPIEKVLPLGGEDMSKSGELHPPYAEAVKYTVAVLELVAVTVKLEEQANVIGGIEAPTITLAEAMALAKLVLDGVEDWMNAVFTSVPVLVARTVIVKVEMDPAFPGTNVHRPLVGS